MNNRSFKNIEHPDVELILAQEQIYKIKKKTQNEYGFKSHFNNETSYNLSMENEQKPYSKIKRNNHFSNNLKEKVSLLEKKSSLLLEKTPSLEALLEKTSLIEKSPYNFEKNANFLEKTPNFSEKSAKKTSNLDKHKEKSIIFLEKPEKAIVLENSPEFSLMLDRYNDNGNNKINNKSTNGINNTKSRTPDKPLIIEKKPGLEEKDRSIHSSCLMNLISKSKNKLKNDEIDLFEDEPKNGVDNYKNVELENYWVFLKNNMGNKNILVIPIEDDEEKEKEDPELWKFPYSDMKMFNEEYRTLMKHNNGKQHNNRNNESNYHYVNRNREKAIINKIKWINCYQMEIPCKNSNLPLRKPKIFNIN